MPGVSDATSALCPGCGSATFTLALTVGDAVSLLRCRACGLVYTWPPVEDAAAADLYPADYYAHRPAVYRPGRLAMVRDLVLHRHSGYPFLTGGARAAWLVDVAGVLLTPLRSVWRSIPPYVAGGRLLDVGCGSGAYPARMRALGWQVCGVEPDADACMQARSVLQLDVHCGTLDSAPWPPQSFDVITLWHTLEHTASPRLTLAAVHTLLRPGGLLMLESPNWNSAQRSIFGRRWLHLDLPRHHVHVTAQVLASYLKACGFTDIRLSSVTSTVGLSGSLEKALGIGPAAAGARPWRHNRLLKALIWPLEALCGVVGRGGCLAATARKP